MLILGLGTAALSAGCRTTEVTGYMPFFLGIVLDCAIRISQTSAEVETAARQILVNVEAEGPEGRSLELDAVWVAGGEESITHCH